MKYCLAVIHQQLIVIVLETIQNLVWTIPYCYDLVPRCRH